MDQKETLERLLHNVKSKSLSLRDAVGLWRAAPAPERREILALMQEAAKDILSDLSELEKTVEHGAKTP